MVNKAAVSVLGVIVLVSMGVGILIGMQLGGPTGGQASGDGDGGGGATPIPSGGTPTPVPPGNQTPPPEGPSTETPDQPSQQTPVSIDRFDSEAIEQSMEEHINEKRGGRGLTRLETTGLLASRIQWMARNHSLAMAEEGIAASNIDGKSTVDRYKEANLFGSCQFEKNNGGATINADSGKFEITDNTFVSNYRNNTDIAETMVDTWFGNRYINDPLLYENANAVGVGVELTDSGELYATVNVC